jgi:hypothetical protein
MLVDGLCMVLLRLSVVMFKYVYSGVTKKRVYHFFLVLLVFLEFSISNQAPHHTLFLIKKTRSYITYLVTASYIKTFWRL